MVVKPIKPYVIFREPIKKGGLGAYQLSVGDVAEGSQAPTPAQSRSGAKEPNMDELGNIYGIVYAGRLSICSSSRFLYVYMYIYSFRRNYI